MKAINGVLWAAGILVLGASACSDSTASRPGTEQGGSSAGNPSNAGAGAGTSAGASVGEGGTPINGGGSPGQAGEGAVASVAGAGGSDAEMPQTSAEYCEAFGKALCTWRSTCAQDDCMTWGGYTRFKQECLDAQASEVAGFVTFVPEAAVACLEVMDFESTLCAPGGPPFTRRSVSAACRDVFAGTVATGDECSQADFAGVFDECGAGYCVRGVGECLGSCAAYKQADETCTVGEVCQPGLFCNDGSCEPPRGVGEDCTASVCENGLRCAGMPPTCRDPVPVGDACVDRFDCESPAECVDDKCAIDLGVGELCQTSEACAAGLFCDRFTAVEPVCATRIAPAAACNSSDDGCVDGYACSQVEPYVCVEAQGGLNEPCGPLGCEGELWCDLSAPGAGTCRAHVALDGECTQDIACVAGLYCVGKEPAKCGPPGASGEPCSALEPRSCEGELFCARDTLTCAAARAVNQTCNPQVPQRSCQDGLFCACLSADCPTIGSSHQPQDICVAQRADGQDCTYGHECSGGYCVSEKCSSTPPASSNCTRAP